MRIRKRFPPHSSVYLSDPQLNRPPVVQQPSIQGGVQVHPHPHGNLCVQEGIALPQPSDPPHQPLTQPSGQRLMIGSENARWVCSDTADEQKIKRKELEGEEVKVERWKEEGKSNNTRKESILGAVVQPLDSSQQEVGRWCEEDKVVPLKKRRRSFDRRESEEVITEKEKKMKAKMKVKTNKKSMQQNDDEEEVNEAIEGIGNSSAKKSKRGSIIMEGSRCSRVNGRGWRCCQPTLVGYSLCEHHLGKGRLRSMNSVRSRVLATATKKDEFEQLSRSLSEQKERNLMDDNGEDDEDDDDKKPLVVVTKKRMKLGTVKARSISSLLGQTNSAVVATSNNENSI